MEIISIENLINASSIRADEIKRVITEDSSMLDSFFDKDTEYQEVEKQIKQLQKKRMQIKSRIMKESEPARLQEKVKELKTQIKEIKIALSDYLSQYVAISGTNQIEGPDGVVRQIISTAKLVKLK